ncbi:MAG: DAK2 domain-containing protein [Chloroflexi bacterium]|nr:DAK2 domain-containing protein [Chloroflexota bacterium]
MEDNKYDGQLLKQALQTAERFLEKRIDELNALNVFPVPDGDTGINMYLTMQAATAAVENVTTSSAAEVSAKVARGALLGARGNSGVILSQILRGIAKGMEMKDRFSSRDFAQALHHASDIAYRSVTGPVEGTIITVIREAADAATRQAERGANLRQTMTAVVTQARQTVERTPELLPRLKEAGVVDAGGKGLCYVFQGMKSFICRKAPQPGEPGRAASQAKLAFPSTGYGFDIQFLVEGDNLPLDEMRAAISGMGDSVLVVGDEHLARVHVHSQQPQAILDYAATRGSLKDVALENMDEQAAKFRAAHQGKDNS